MGNTIHSRTFLITSWDHTHICGEYQDSLSDETKYLGSPSLAWGIRFIAKSDILSEGITLMHMGNTLRNPHIITMREGMNEENI